MLQREQVEPRLREIPRVSARLDELLATFNRDRQNPRQQDFLIWLEAERHLSRAELARLMDEDQITVTSIRSRQPRDTSGDEDTVIHDVTAIREGAIKAGTSSPTEDEQRYVILGQAGRGGMATVHVARDTELMRKVAFKSLLADEADASQNDVELRDRFIREVQITAQLDHPYIVPVYSLEVGSDGNPAYTMKLIEGCTFAAYLDDTRAFYVRGERPDETHELPARLDHFLKVCDAMHYAHGKGIVHRDLKPANVMIGRHNEVYVMDWGICRMMSEAVVPGAESAEPIVPATATDASQTRDGSLMGTPRYMSPEQANGRLTEVGPASDQCALGLILFEVVTLQAPFAGETMLEILKNAARGVLRPIAHAYERQAVPRELAAIIRKATAVNPAARYADVGALADDLRRYLRGAAVLARPDSLWQAAGRWVARHRQLALLGFVVVLMLGISAELLTLRHEHFVEKQALTRERGLIRVMDTLSQRRERLGDRLLHAEEGLQRFAAAAEEGLVEGQGSDDRYYVPADLAESRSQMSSGQSPAVWTYPSTLSQVDAEQRIRRLATLHDHRLELVADLGDLRKAGDSSGATAFVGMSLATADGLTWTYPGRADLPADFDARQSRWYTANHAAAPRWLGPYADQGNAQMLVVVSALVREADDQQLGVAALMLSAAELRQEFLQPAGIPNAARVLLLDPVGRVLLDSVDQKLTASAPPLFPDAELVAAMQAANNGYRETVQAGHRYLAAYSRLPVAGWSLLALIDDAPLLAP